MIRLQAQITIDGNEDALHYHGNTLDETELARLIKQLVYEHTNAYDGEITVSVMRLGVRDTDQM